jgi:hypothetical protein
MSDVVKDDEMEKDTASNELNGIPNNHDCEFSFIY